MENLNRKTFRIYVIIPRYDQNVQVQVQSGASSPAKHGDAYFSAVYGSIQDPIAAPGPYETQGTNPCEQK